MSDTQSEQPLPVLPDHGDLIAVPAGVVRFIATTFGRHVWGITIRKWVDSGRLPTRKMLGRQWTTAADVLAATAVQS